MNSENRLQLDYPNTVKFVRNELSKMKERGSLSTFAKEHKLHYQSLVSLRTGKDETPQATFLKNIIEALGYTDVEMERVVRFKFNLKK